MGSPINTIYKSVLGKIATLEALENKLMDVYSKKTNKDKGEGMLKSISELNKEIINIRLETIATFNPSLVTIKELYFLRNDLTTDSLRLLFAKFPLSMKKTKYGEVISQYLLTGPIKIGSSASDISGKDFNKKSINLSLFKSKIVLLDFWASWCGSCRMSNKDLAELYKKYHASGFEIISFSLDNELEDWKNASNEDSITWINISDLMGFYSKQAANYKIRGLPHSFLIDQNGKIIQILSGYGKNSLTTHESNIQNLTKK